LVEGIFVLHKIDLMKWLESGLAVSRYYQVADLLYTEWFRRKSQYFDRW